MPEGQDATISIARAVAEGDCRRCWRQHDRLPMAAAVGAGDGGPQLVRDTGAPRGVRGAGAPTKVVRSIADESVRKYYSQDFSDRLRARMAPQSARAGVFFSGRSRNGVVCWRPEDRRGHLDPVPRRTAMVSGSFPGRPSDLLGSGRQADLATRRPAPGFEPIAPPSARRLSSEPDRARVPTTGDAAARGAHSDRRDQSSLAHGAPRRGVFRTRVPQSGHRSPAPGGFGCSPARVEPVAPDAVRSAIAVRGLDRVLDRVEAAITHSSDWPARAGASEGTMSSNGGRTLLPCILRRGSER